MQLHLNTKSIWWLIKQRFSREKKGKFGSKDNTILCRVVPCGRTDSRADGWTDVTDLIVAFRMLRKLLKIIEKICLTINTQGWSAAFVIWKQNFRQCKLIFMQLSTTVLLKQANYWYSLQQWRCPLLSSYEQISNYLSGHITTVTWIHYHCKNIVPFYGTGQKAQNSL